MKFTGLITLFAAGFAAAQQQRAASIHWNDTRTGISFEGFRNADIEIGFALPSNITVTNELIVQLTGRVAGWAGISFGGGMTNNLLLIAWVNGQSILSSFRFTPMIQSPPAYNKNPAPTVTPLCETGAVNGTHFTYTFVCKGCNQWLNNNNQQAGWNFNAATQLIGRATNIRAKPNNPSDRSSAVQAHTEANQFVLNIPRAKTDQYEAFKSACVTVPKPPVTTLSV